MADTKYIDYLKEDEPLSSQKWVCVSFLSPEGIKNCSLRGLKIRGSYSTKEEANARADQLHQLDPDFHVFVGEVGKWLPWDPEPSEIKDQVYLEKQLNDLMHNYNENMEKSKVMQEQRKSDMIKQAAKEEQDRLKSQTSREDKARDKARKTLATRKQQDHMNNVAKELNISQNEKELKELDEGLKEEEKHIGEEMKQMNSVQTEINNKEKEISTLDSKLDKIKELYDKLSKNK